MKNWISPPKICLFCLNLTLCSVYVEKISTDIHPTYAGEATPHARYTTPKKCSGFVRVFLCSTSGVAPYLMAKSVRFFIAPVLTEVRSVRFFVASHRSHLWSHTEPPQAHPLKYTRPPLKNRTNRGDPNKFREFCTAITPVKSSFPQPSFQPLTKSQNIFCHPLWRHLSPCSVLPQLTPVIWLCLSSMR